MKVKTILIAFLVAGLFLGAAACGLSEQELREQGYIETARGVAESIPLPTFYCPIHGVACEPEDIKVEACGYDTATGEPILTITCWVKCPTFWAGHKEEGHKFYLCVKSGGGFYYDFLPKVPLSVLTDDEVEKLWR